MALKFLNKKGWHTGSLRNIENVWKAEQKHETEQKKLDELRKQIQEERERDEFRQLQVQAGYAPRQERLDFLYDSGLAVGKGSSDGFKTLELPPKVEADSDSYKSVPGALFEEKPKSANDAWRKLHSDPLLLIRQREQEALSRIKNNPVQMALIRKSAEAVKIEKHKHKKRKTHNRKYNHKRYSSELLSDSNESETEVDNRGRKIGEDANRKPKHGRDSFEIQLDSEPKRSTDRLGSHPLRDSSRMSSICQSASRGHSTEGTVSRHHDVCITRRCQVRDSHLSQHKQEEPRSWRNEGHKRCQKVPKLSTEEKAARAREMQYDAELHDEQRWKRLKKASEADAQEALKDARLSGGKNFLDTTRKNMFGTEGDGSSTIEKSIRRKTFYLQGRSEAEEKSAFHQ